VILKERDLPIWVIYGRVQTKGKINKNRNKRINNQTQSKAHKARNNKTNRRRNNEMQYKAKKMYTIHSTRSKQNSLCSQKNLGKVNVHIFLIYKNKVSSNGAQKYGNILVKLHEEFSKQFKYFKKIENKIQLLTYLFSFSV
jgi:ABC-type methionine transport system ATPase subunit